MGGIPRFTKQRIAMVDNNVSAGNWNCGLAIGDLDNDGRPDIMITGRQGRMVWLQNLGAGNPWVEHLVGPAEFYECGGTIIDIDGDGWNDIVNGTDMPGDSLFWFRNPGASGRLWERHTIARTGRNFFHDTKVGRLGNETEVSVVFTNQGTDGTNVCRVRIPHEPTVSPWPGLEIVATGKKLPNTRRTWPPFGIQQEEGLALGDVDGDGEIEIVCGTWWYKLTKGGWQGHCFCTEYYITTKVAIADVNGDGRNEIILSEGDPCIYGIAEGGKLGWFAPTGDVRMPWTEHRVMEGLLDGHTLQTADLCGNGRQDIVVGEVGVTNGDSEAYGVRPPCIWLLENDGSGGFRRHLIDEGTGIHEGQLVDLYGTGRLDLVGKPLHGDEKWGVHVWENVAQG